MLVIRRTFNCICILITLYLVIQWGQRYQLDEDVTVVETRSFGATEDDVFPVMSICFGHIFDDDVFSRFGVNITGRDYVDYLQGGGKYFDEGLWKIDYHNITTSLLENIISYRVNYVNQTRKDVMSSTSFKQPYYTYSFDRVGIVNKCFSLEVTDTLVEGIKFYVKSDIFGNNSGFSNAGIAFLFHSIKLESSFQ